MTLMKNVEITLQISVTQTEDTASSSGVPEEREDGTFRLILDESHSLNIDKLEQGLLRTGFPAIREALSKYVEGELKKSDSTTGSERTRRADSKTRWRVPSGW